MIMRMDTSVLEAAIKMRLLALDREEHEILNTSAYYIAIGAKERTPFATQEKIDLDLKVAVNLTITKRGRISKRQSRKSPNYSSHRMGDIVTSKPLAVLIMLARANHSPNQRKRYWMDKSQFKTGTRAGNQRAMSNAINRMIKSRHSSTKFLRSGWEPAITELSPHAIKRRGSAPWVEERRDYGFAVRGYAIPAIREGDLCRVEIANTTGMSDSEPDSTANEALWIHSGPGLQEAIDEEAAGMVNWMAKHLVKSDQFFNRVCA